MRLWQPGPLIDLLLWANLGGCVALSSVLLLEEIIHPQAWPLRHLVRSKWVG